MRRLQKTSYLLAHCAAWPYRTRHPMGLNAYTIVAQHCVMLNSLLSRSKVSDIAGDFPTERRLQHERRIEAASRSATTM